MLQFRSHWLGKDTLEEFKVDFDACMWLTGFTRLFFVVRFLNADLDGYVDTRPSTPTTSSTFRDSLRFQLDQHRKRGATIDSFRIVQEEILNDVLRLIDKKASIKDRDESLFAIIQKINAMELPATWELQSAAPYRVHFKFPPWSKVSKRRRELSQFYNGLLVHGCEWGKNNLPKGVQVTAAKNADLFRLGRGARVLELHGYRWIVKRWFTEPKDFRQDIYSSLISSLEDGSFSRLGRCRQCSLFFIAEDGKQHYCSKQCSREFTNADAKNRIRRYRQNLQKRRSEDYFETYLQKLVRAEAGDFKGKLLPIYKRLGGPLEGRKFIRNLRGGSWRGLTREAQAKLSAILPLLISLQKADL